MKHQPKMLDTFRWDDPLGRRIQSRDPLGGLLATTYDSQDQPLSITGPRGLSTHADPNVWGEVQEPGGCMTMTRTATR